MDLRLIEIFCRVYQERSFSRAARALGLTQPTVSVHIRDLEQSLGTALFNRLGREIQPTEAGNFLYEHSRSLIALKSDLAQKMAGFLNRVEGLLTVGASSVPGEYLLPSLVTAFRAKYPGVRARLRISDTAETIEYLRHGDIEIGVVGATMEDPELAFETLAGDELVLAAPAEGICDGRSQVSLMELRELPMIVREPGSGTRMALERSLKHNRISLGDCNVAAEFGSLGAIKEAVRQGCGVSFLSELTVAAEIQVGRMRRLRVPELGTIARSYYTVVNRRRVLSPVTREFLDYLLRKKPRRPSRPHAGPPRARRRS
ncbi:MAG: selenium metabolism-associated LysR family transcriptional regulator [Candidatus Binataceae bacterium]